ncbi:MAG: hypothetical protein KAV82_09235 [Phycisphaerae bacterium]|nr:hypothetical protein [Phycisphaerae bacterium]
MPRKRVKAAPPHSHPELVEVLVEELRRNSPEERPGFPYIREEEQPYGNSLHVTIIWERWRDVLVEERGAIILDAYRQVSEEDDYRRITMVLGLTEAEAQKMKISY